MSVGAVNHWVKAYREDGLTAHVPERRGYGSYRGETTPDCGTRADRDFTAGMPNEKWFTDITRDQGPGREGHVSRRRSTATAAGSSRTRPVGPNAGLADRMLVKAAESLPEGAHPLVRSDRGCHCRWPGWLDLMGRYGLARSTGTKELFSGRRRRGGVLRSNEDGVRLSRALGRRGARLGRRLHPLARPRAHQTVAWLDESCTIPSKPGNGCVTISKKTPAAPYLRYVWQIWLLDMRLLAYIWHVTHENSHFGGTFSDLSPHATAIYRRDIGKARSMMGQHVRFKARYPNASSEPETQPLLRHKDEVPKYARIQTLLRAQNKALRFIPINMS